MIVFNRLFTIFSLQIGLIDVFYFAQALSHGLSHSRVKFTLDEWLGFILKYILFLDLLIEAIFKGHTLRSSVRLRLIIYGFGCFEATCHLDVLDTMKDKIKMLQVDLENEIHVEEVSDVCHKILGLGRNLDRVQNFYFYVFSDL